MCVACHTENDPNYPSALMLGATPGSCSDCHMKPEAVDVSWAEDLGRAVRLEVLADGSAGAEARALLETAVSDSLRARGIRLVGKEEADLELIVSLRLEFLRDDRFLVPGTPVRRASLEAIVSAPGEEKPILRRLAESKPEWGTSAEEASNRAVKDAWAVLSSHVIEALGTH